MSPSEAKVDLRPIITLAALGLPTRNEEKFGSEYFLFKEAGGCLSQIAYEALRYWEGHNSATKFNDMNIYERRSYEAAGVNFKALAQKAGIEITAQQIRLYQLLRVPYRLRSENRQLHGQVVSLTGNLVDPVVAADVLLFKASKADYFKFIVSFDSPEGKTTIPGLRYRHNRIAIDRLLECRFSRSNSPDETSILVGSSSFIPTAVK